MRRLVFLSVLAVLALAPPVAMYALASPGAAAADGKLLATVGPGPTIGLVDEAGAMVTRLAPGTYTIEIDDRSAEHNFHLIGPGGVSAGTTIAFVGVTTITVTLGDGEYTYVCDAHAYDMLGRFAVGNPPSTPTTTSPPPAPPSNRLVATVGPGPTITLTRGGRKVTALRRGVYRITVRDRSRLHNFHLIGPGISRKTGVPFVGTQTWRVTLRPGLYRYRCNPHVGFMRGTVRVR